MFKILEHLPHNDFLIIREKDSDRSNPSLTITPGLFYCLFLLRFLTNGRVGGGCKNRKKYGLIKLK